MCERERDDGDDVYHHQLHVLLIQLYCTKANREVAASVIVTRSYFGNNSFDECDIVSICFDFFVNFSQLIMSLGNVTWTPTHLPDKNALHNRCSLWSILHLLRAFCNLPFTSMKIGRR